MRNLIQGSPVKATSPANAKFLIIVGRKAESRWFPASMTAEQVKAVLVDRQEILPDTRVIRG